MHCRCKQTPSESVHPVTAENWRRSQTKAEIEQCWAVAPWCSESPMVNDVRVGINAQSAKQTQAICICSSGAYRSDEASQPTTANHRSKSAEVKRLAMPLATSANSNSSGASGNYLRAREVDDGVQMNWGSPKVHFAN